MKKESTDDQILTMLQLSRSYSEIQNELGVSPNRISSVKKQFLSDGDSNVNLFTPLNSEASSNNIDFDSKKIVNPLSDSTDYHKNRSIDNRNQYYPKSDSEIELEKYKLQLEHEREMVKLDILKEKQQKDQAQKEKELSLLEAMNKRQVEKEQNKLLKKFKKLVSACVDDDWTYNETIELLDITQELKDGMTPHRQGVMTGEPFVDEIRTLELLNDFLTQTVDEWDENDEDAYSFEFPETLQLYIDHYK